MAMNLGCLLNGHKVTDRTDEGIEYEKMPDYPTCINCKRRISWFYDGSTEGFSLVRPHKR